MEHTHAFHPLDYQAVLWRRKWWLIVPAALTAVVGVAIAVGLPRTYRSSATLGVALPSLSPDILASQRSNAPERLRAIQQVLFSPSVLERVAREEGLDSDVALPEAAARLRARVTADIGRPNPALPAGSLEHFSIAHTAPTPEAAQRVANRLADAFIEEHARRRGVRAGETSAFIGAQLLATRSRLDAFEARLAQAKEAYMGSLPEQTAANVAMVAALQTQLETTANVIRSEQDRLAVVERQIEQLEETAAGLPDPAGGGPPIALAPGARVLQLERDLALMRRQYTDRHPAVARLQAELDLAHAAAAGAADPGLPRVAPSLAADRGYQALLQSRQTSELRLRDLGREDSRIRTEIDQYRARVEQAPRVEQQLATLQREYDLEREQWAHLAGRLRTAEMDERLAQRNGTEQFVVLSYAPLPSVPDSPNVPRLLLVTILFGACIGGGLALAREYLDRSIYDTRELADLGAPVLGEIPRIAQT